jgi:hypothetical protein
MSLVYARLGALVSNDNNCSRGTATQIKAKPARCRQAAMVRTGV